VRWFRLIRPVKVAGQLEADQSSHAVPEKGEWTIHVGSEHWRGSGNQVNEFRKGPLPHLSAPARKLDSTYLDLLAQLLRPMPEDVRGPARIRKTKEPQPRPW
jgi:hypothetical protein